MYRYPLSLFLLVVLLLSGCSSGPKPLGPDASPDRLPEIAGDYIVNGFDPTGIEYGGRLKVAPGGLLGVYQLEWLISGGMQTGSGRLEGNQLKAEWHSLASQGRKEMNGTVVYTITTNGELYGPKSLDGYPTSGTETAYPNSPENMSY
jgi:hypothetical protein